MTGSKILDSGKLFETASAVYALAEEVNNNFKKLQDDLDSTIGTDVWNGERARAFKAKWDEFATCFKPVVEKIIEISGKAKAVGQQAEHYTEG